MIFMLKEPTLKDFIRVLFNKTVFANKPLSVSIEGESGAGKSVLTLLIAEYLKQLFKFDCDLSKHFIYTPEDFDKAIEHVFFSDCNFPALFVQETVSFAPSWLHPLSKKNPAIKIYQILNLSREVKPIAVFICEQQFTDLYSKIRRRMNLFFKIVRYVTSSGYSLNPCVFVFTRSPLTDSLVFVTPTIYVGGKRVRNPRFVVPKLPEEFLAKFKDFDRRFKEKYIKELISNITDNQYNILNKPIGGGSNNEGIEVSCYKCGYRWIYSGKRKARAVTCPNCMAKIMLDK